jgi:hypothetical protein
MKLACGQKKYTLYAVLEGMEMRRLRRIKEVGN